MNRLALLLSGLALGVSALALWQTWAIDPFAGVSRAAPMELTVEPAPGYYCGYHDCIIHQTTYPGLISNLINNPEIGQYCNSFGCHPFKPSGLTETINKGIDR
jgi:hypothetical protein